MTRQPLREASREELKAFGTDLATGLIRKDGLVVYPVRNGIPLLVEPAAIHPGGAAKPCGAGVSPAIPQ